MSTMLDPKLLDRLVEELAIHDVIKKFTDWMENVGYHITWIDEDRDGDHHEVTAEKVVYQYQLDLDPAAERERDRIEELAERELEAEPVSSPRWMSEDEQEQRIHY